VKLAFAILLALALGGAANASEPADTKTGSRVDPNLRPVVNARGNADQLVYRFSECAAARRTSRVKAMLDARTDTAYKKEYAALYDIQRCDFGGYGDADTFKINADRGVLRGLLAEALIKQSAAVAVAPLPGQRVYARDWYEMTGRPRPLDEMATCVADIDPAGISALLHTPLGGKEEGAAIGAISPSLGTCLAVGYKLSANALSLRTALAEGLYHRMYDAPPKSVEAAK